MYNIVHICCIVYIFAYEDIILFDIFLKAVIETVFRFNTSADRVSVAHIDQIKLPAHVTFQGCNTIPEISFPAPSVRSTYIRPGSISLEISILFLRTPNFFISFG